MRYYLEVERSEFLSIIWEAYESGDLIPICAWCQRVEVQGEWVFAPPGTLETIDRPMVLSHSMCPTCSANTPASPSQSSS
jgi:hypothetical protein